MAVSAAVSATLAANQVVAARRAAGLPVLAMSFGQAGVPVHPLLSAALTEAAEQNGYGPVAGSAALREAAAGYWTRRGLPTTADQVVSAPGSKALLYAALLAIGGDVVLPMPSWVSYAQQIAITGGRALWLPTLAGQGGVADPDQLADTVRTARAAGRDVRGMVLTVPDNPTGTLAEPATIRRVCELARELDLTVISDEIYRDLVYRKDFLSPAEVAPERVIVTGGLSKNLALGGWRSGVARFPDGSGLRDKVISIASELWSCSPRPVEHAAALAFTEPAELRSYVDGARSLYAAVNGAVGERFAAVGARITPPDASFYVYPDFEPHRELLADRHGVRTGADLAALLLDTHGLAVLPGAEFGEAETSLTLRVATGNLTGEDDDQRRQALDAADPLALPWISRALDQLSDTLSTVVKPA